MMGGSDEARFRYVPEVRSPALGSEFWARTRDTNWRQDIVLDKLLGRHNWYTEEQYRSYMAASGWSSGSLSLLDRARELDEPSMRFAVRVHPLMKPMLKGLTRNTRRVAEELVARPVNEAPYAQFAAKVFRVMRWATIGPAAGEEVQFERLFRAQEGQEQDMLDHLVHRNPAPEGGQGQPLILTTNTGAVALVNPGHTMVLRGAGEPPLFWQE